MRSRLLAALLGLVLLTLLLFAVPRALIVAQQTREREALEVSSHASSLQSTLQARLHADEPVTREHLEHQTGELDAVTLHFPDGRTLRVGPELRPESVAIAVRRTLADGSTLEIHRSELAVAQALAEALMPFVAPGLTVLVVAAVVAVVMSRWIARPFAELASAAERLGEGTFEVRLDDYSLPEAHAIARSLRSSRDRLEALVRHERAFASNASHQLRSPLTALRLEIEDLAESPELDEHLRAHLSTALREVDRLAETVSGLLDMARVGSLGDAEQFDLDQVAHEAVSRWRPAAERADRRIEVRDDGTVPVKAPVTAVQQILDVLIDNALIHGLGRILVTTDGIGEHARIRVADEGPGVDRGAVADLFTRRARRTPSGGEGIGLALAREIADSLGGRLTVSADPPTTFVLLLPRAHEAVGASR